MRHILTILCLCLLVPSVVVAGSEGIPAGQRHYKLNDVIGKNSLEFVSDAPMEVIHGTADGIVGTFDMDVSNLAATKGNITVEVRSMKTAIAKRDQHMYSAKWLDADKYPSITFAITGLKQITSSFENGKHVVRGVATGMFTVHGQTKPITADVNIMLVPESADTKRRAPGNLVLITAMFNVALADYAIVGGDGVVGSSVGEVIKITATLYANG